MTVAEAVRAVLLDMAPVASLVGTRVRLVKLRQSEPTFPVIRVQRVSEVEDMHLRGSIGVKRARVQVDAIVMEGSGVDFYASASAVASAVNGPGDGTGLCGFTGIVGSPAFRFHSVVPAGVQEAYDADDLKQFKIMRDYMIQFSED